MGVQPAKPDEMEAVRLLVRSLGPGHFSMERIHHQHRADSAGLGREPMNAVRLGQVLKEYGALKKPKWDKHKERPNKPKGFPKGYMVKGWIL